MSIYDAALLPSQRQQPGTFVTRTPGPNELVKNQLTDLLGSDSAYIQQARKQAAAQGAARGLLNSSMAAGAGQAAAIQAGLPIAQQDAATWAGAAKDNMAAENDYYLRAGDWATSRYGANSAAGASMYSADLNFKANMARLDNDRSQFAQQLQWDKDRFGQDWDHQVQGAVLGNRLGQQAGFNAAMWNTIFSNPEYLRDPSGASGMVNYWGGQFNQQLNSQLDPYLAQFGFAPRGGNP